MISANEAKELYYASGAEVEDFLTKTIEPAVIKAAKGGKRQATIDIGCQRASMPYEIKSLDSNVLAKLRNLGYTAGIQWIDDAYVPRGLQDDSGKGTLHRNYGYVIKW
jgi:hypothetical protein